MKFLPKCYYGPGTGHIFSFSSHSPLTWVHLSLLPLLYSPGVNEHSETALVKEGWVRQIIITEMTSFFISLHESFGGKNKSF